MKTTLTFILMLLTLADIQAQEAGDRRGNQFEASVQEVRGACYVRNNESAQLQKLRLNDKLSAGQEVSCDRDGYLKLLFRGGGTEKEIRKFRPNWYVIPNIPSHGVVSPKVKRAGRSKGNDPPAQASSSTQDPEPENNKFDEADLFWKSRKKYLLVVAASKTGGTGNDLPFTKVDGERISQTFTSCGYKQLEMLEGKRATHDNFVEQLQKIRTFPEDTTVVVYYSGHAVKDPQNKDLWLQLYGQTQFGDHYGLSLSNIIGAARGNTFKGDLVIILDACYSGEGTLSSQLSLRETDKTIIFASSATYQQSYSVKLSSGDEISAFTYYLLQGLGPDWLEVDGDSDGIILYNDLQIYIENKLLELLSKDAILGKMQPQLVGQSPQTWAAYDVHRAHNFESATRKNLRLQRQFQVQNPEQLMKNLAHSSLPSNVHAYLRALKALNKQQFDEAWRLLDIAEQEKKVPLAEVYWARAEVKAEQLQLSSARDLLEKALALCPQQNADLIEIAAAVNFGVGNWARARELFKLALEIKGGGKEDNPEVIGDIVLLTMLDIVSGESAEAELYLRRAKAFDPTVLDEQEEGLSQMIPFLELLLDLVQGKKEDAKRKIDELRESLASMDGVMKEVLSPVLQLMDTIPDANGSAPSNITTLLTDKLREWDEDLQRKDVNRIIFLLTHLSMAASEPSATDSLRTQDVDLLLKRTVDFARQHKSQKQKVIIQTSTGTREIDSADSEKQSLMESANIITGAATIYAARRDTAEAEKLFKEAIALGEEQKIGALLSLNPIMRLGELYTNNRRFNNAEFLYKNFLAKLRESVGETTFYSFIIQEALGDVYEQQEKWAEAEQSYRANLQLFQSGFGRENIAAFDAQRKLATFLLERGQYTEAVTLFEQIIEGLKKKAGPALLKDCLGDDYYNLARGYYYLKNYTAAESSFQKAADIYSSTEPNDLTDMCFCLLWQWYTADALKKPNEAAHFYQELVKLVQANMVQGDPDKELGANLRTSASSFINAKAYAESEQLLHLALTIETKVYGSQSSEVAQVWESFAELARARMQYEDSISCLKKAQAIYEKPSSPDLERLSSVFYWMGFASYRRQEFEQARVYFLQSIDTIQRIPEASRPNFDSSSRHLLGRVQRKLGQYPEARINLNAALDLDEQEQIRKPSSIVSDAILSDLLETVAILRSQGKRAEAEQFLIRAQIAAEKTSPKRMVRLARLQHERGMLALLSSKSKEAEELLHDAIKKVERDPEMDPVLLVEFMDNYVSVLRKRGKNKEASLVEQQAKQIRDQLRNGK